MSCRVSLFTLALAGVASTLHAEQLTDCYLQLGNAVAQINYEDNEECNNFITSLVAAQSAADISLCPTRSTMRRCIRQQEPQLAKMFRDCALNDNVDGEFCIRKEDADDFVAEVLTPILADLGVICLDVVVEQVVEIESSAMQYYGCSDYIDVDVDTISKFINMTLPGVEGEFVNMTLPGVEEEGGIQTSAGAPGPDYYIYYYYNSSDSEGSYAPYSEGPYIAYNNPIIPDPYEVCLHEVGSLWYKYLQNGHNDECQVVVEAEYTYDEEKCPTIEQVDACTMKFLDQFKEQLEGCSERDGVDGNTCLTPEKLKRIVTKVTKVHQYSEHCLEAFVHFYHTAMAAIVEVAGCDEFIDGQLAGGPFSGLDFIGIEPYNFPSYPYHPYPAIPAPVFGLFPASVPLPVNGSFEGARGPKALVWEDESSSEDSSEG